MNNTFILLLIFLFNICPSFGQQESVLSNGDWYKLAVVDDGVYKIDRSFIQNLGISIGNIDPRNIRLYGNGGGMLLQKNSNFRYSDLEENNIFVQGESDGSFDSNDYILFYGENSDRIGFSNSDNTLFYEQNIYSDTTYYFLTISDTPGKRIQSTNNTDKDLPIIDTYDYYSVHEEDIFTLLFSGREWYGERLSEASNQEFRFPINKIAANSMIKIRAAVMGQSFVETTFDVSVNSFELGTIPVKKIVDRTYVDKGVDIVKEFEMSADLLNNTNPVVSVKFNKSSQGRSDGYLNYLLLSCKRILELDLNGQTIFRSIASKENAESKFFIDNTTANTVIWDITKPLVAYQIETKTEGSGKSFSTETLDLKEFVAFDPASCPSPSFIKKVKNQSLRGSTSIDFLIVTVADFITEANRLADFRRSHDNLRVKVVTVDQIYNEFSSGAQDVSAIRDYFKYLYDNGGLRYALMFGECSYDFKHRQFNNTNIVPIYQSRNSLHPVSTYASDDYFGFMSDEEGDWDESSSGDHSLEIGIGRFPIATLVEAKAIVDKLIHYEGTETLGEWRKQIYFVADDGDSNLHLNDADLLARQVKNNAPTYDINKLYLDSFVQTSFGSTEKSETANTSIQEAVEKGAFLINYTGHGGELGWAQESILDNETVMNFENTNKLPLFVTATCEFGRHDDPKRRSGGELLVLNPQGGAIALLTTSRPVAASSNQLINKAFYEAVFKKENGNHLRLGDIVRLTKNNSLNGSSNRNFILIGDPSMQLSYPEKEIKLNSLNDQAILDDTVSALGLIKFDGEILNLNGIKDEKFNGSLFLTLFDKETTTETFGDQSNPTTFTKRNSILFRGQSSIKEGEFEIEFVVPKNIEYRYGKGKISMYALSDSTSFDAAGADNNIIIGGSENDVPEDNEPPTVALFMDDTSFIDGGLTGNRTHLLVRLEDENGINISNNGFGQNLEATLDGDVTFNLNEFYLADKDHFESGWVNFPLFNLEEGKHTLEVKAWDTYNNASIASIKFNVIGNSSISMNNLMNYPNPVTESTSFSFDHNRAGEDLEVKLEIFSTQGKIIHSIDHVIKNSNTRIKTLNWNINEDSGNKIENGIYVYRLFVRSMTDGAKNQAIQKLIIIN